MIVSTIKTRLSIAGVISCMIFVVAAVVFAWLFWKTGVPPLRRAGWHEVGIHTDYQVSWTRLFLLATMVGVATQVPA